MKPYNLPNIIPVGTVMNTTINSTAIQVYNSFVYYIRVAFTGTPTGVFKLQTSGEPAFSGKPGEPGSSSWTDVSATGSQFTVSAAGDVAWNAPYPGYNWVRVVYTDTSSGSSTAVISYSIVNVKGQ